MIPAGDELLALLPHRAPFLFLTRIDLIESDRAEGVWSVGGDEAFFAGHFPGQPVVPGVLVVEALAQLVGVVVGNTTTQGRAYPAPQGSLAMIDVRFFATATPPVEISLSVRLQRGLGKLWLFDVAAAAGPRRLAAGTLTLALEKPRA